MKKLLMIAFILALSMFIGISGYTKSNVKNHLELQIVPSSQALIAVSIHEPFKITVLNEGNEDNLITPAQGTADIRITNHSTNNLTIRSIRCVTGGFAGVSIDYDAFLGASRTLPARITVEDSGKLAAAESLSFEFEAEWDGGRAIIGFYVPVETNAVESPGRPDTMPGLAGV